MSSSESMATLDLPILALLKGWLKMLNEGVNNNCAWRVVSERRRNFKRNPTVDAIRPVVDRAEQVGSLPEVLDSKLEEEGLPGLALLHPLADGVIVEVRFLNGVIEDRRV